MSTPNQIPLSTTDISGQVPSVPPPIVPVAANVPPPVQGSVPLVGSLPIEVDNPFPPSAERVNVEENENRRMWQNL
jgi:hypothetical protein